MVQLNYFKLYADAKEPYKAHYNDACYDVFAYIKNTKHLKTTYSVAKTTTSPMMADLTIVKHEEVRDVLPILGEEDDSYVMLPANSSTIIPTGIIYGIPQGYRIDVKARSGRAAKYRQYLTNSVGTIDSGYPDQLYVMLTNASAESCKLVHNDKIAQFSLEVVLPVELNEVYSNQDVQQGIFLRGGGLGSTGDR